MNKGITLIALIITVIILLILAGTAISISINGGDLFTKATQARDTWNTAISAEDKSIKEAVGYLIPSAPTDIIKTGFTSTSIKVKAMGGTAYKYKLNTSDTWSESIPNGIEYEFNGLTENQTYTIQAKCTNSFGDGTETVEKQMKPQYEGNIGKYIHYNINLNIGNNSVDDDWVVFYEDQENKLTYLIAADYVPNTNAALTTAKTALGLSESGTYTVSNSSTNSLLKTSINQSVAIRNKLSWYNSAMEPYTVTKHKLVASLLDLNAWDGFVLKNVSGVNAGDIQAVGGATIELWMASWNQRGYFPLYYSINTDPQSIYESGYKVGWSENSTYGNTTTQTIGNTGYNKNDESKHNKVYFPRTESTVATDDICYGYWLASPSAINNPPDRGLMFIACGGEVGYYYTYNPMSLSIRPVVSLPTRIIGTDNSSEIYYLNTNIND